MMTFGSTTLRAFALLGLSTFGVQGGLLIDAGPQSTIQVFSPGQYVAGTEFTTSTTFTIRALGYLDPYGTGLQGSREVGLWDTAQNLLASVIVTPTSATILSAQGTGMWYLENIQDTIIGPGTYRVAGWVDPMADALSDDKIGNGVTLSAGYVRTDFPNGGFAYPGLSFGSEAVRATLSDTNVQGAAVPEPTTIGLVGLGLAGLVLRARRRRS